MDKLLEDLLKEVNTVKDHYETASQFNDDSEPQAHYTQKARRAVDNCRTLIKQLKETTGE